MAEEQKTEEGKQTEVVEKPQLTEIEKRALEQGWRPKDEWDGDPEDFRSAREFLDRGQLFKKIDEQGKTIKQFKQTLEEFAKHHSRVQKVEYERAKADLLAQKKLALREGDADAVVDLDEKLDLVKQAQNDIKPIEIPDTPAELHPEFVAWIDRNSWYEHQPAMKAYADKIGYEMGAKGMSRTDILAAVEREVKKEFAHRFNNPNRDKPGAVEGSTNKGKVSKEEFPLDEYERRAMQKFINTIPGYTKEKYIAELKKIKGVS